MKTVKFPTAYDGPLTVPARYPTKPRPSNIEVTLVKGEATLTNAQADALIAGGQFELVEDHGADPVVVPSSAARGVKPAVEPPSGGEVSEPDGDSGAGTATTENIDSNGEPILGGSGDGQPSSETPETTEATEVVEAVEAVEAVEPTETVKVEEPIKEQPKGNGKGSSKNR